MRAPDRRRGLQVRGPFAALAVILATMVPVPGVWAGSECDADLDSNGSVDRRDLDRLLLSWGEPNADGSDIDSDGRVDALDVAILARSWEAWSTRGCRRRLNACARGETTAAQGFWEYLPDGYESRRRWPLLVFLHGMGENGDGSIRDLERVLVHGPPALIASDAWPVARSDAGDEFVVLSPQHSGAADGCHEGGDVADFLAWAIERYDVDPDRVYLTGLSCGGYGIWNYLEGCEGGVAEWIPAAVVPICGDGRNAWETHGCELGGMPIWVFHGDADRVVPFAGSDVPMRGLRACGDDRVVDARYVAYPGCRHDSWTRTYDLSAGHDIYAWMLSHGGPSSERRRIPD